MKKIFYIYTMIAMLLSGCGEMPMDAEKKMEMAEVNTMEGTIMMTEKEIELLSAIYADAARIKEGKLFSHQEESLRELRAGMQYLAEKYPDADLEILIFEPATKWNASASALFRDQSDKNYFLAITPKDGSYICTDTYYGALLHEAYDTRVCEILAHDGYSVLAYTEFPALMGAEINAQTTTEELIGLKSKLARNTSLFIELPADKEFVREAIQKCLLETDLYGAYTLYFVPAAENTEVSELLKNKTNWEKTVFSCFDVN